MRRFIVDDLRARFESRVDYWIKINWSNFALVEFNGDNVGYKGIVMTF